MIQISEFTRELIANGGFPVKHLSYSSIKEYLGNPRSFLKKYIRYEFDDQTKAVFMVGKSVHKSLEVYFEYYKKGEMIPVELQEDGSISAHSVGLRHFERELEESRGKAITKWIQWFDDKFAYPIFTKDYTDDQIRDLYSDVKKEAAKYIEIPEEIKALGDPEKEIEYLDQFLSANVENALITLGADQTLEDLIDESKRKIIASIDNFFAFDWIPEGEVHSTEKEEVVFFEDETGEEMPIPVKAIIDRVDIVSEEDSVDGTKSGVVKKEYSIVTDYKTVDKFSLTDADKADYEMQAGTNYFAALVATWVKPRYMRFVEILKKTPSYIHPEQPDKYWKKEDLILEIKTSLPDHVLGGKELVTDLKKVLIDAGIFVKETWVNIFEINFEERPDIILTFLAMYKGVVNMIGLCEIAGTYLPNISAQWGGIEAWNDFKEFEGTPRDRTPNIKVLAWEKLEEADPVKVDHDVATKVETTPNEGNPIPYSPEDDDDDLEGIDSL